MLRSERMLCVGIFAIFCILDVIKKKKLILKTVFLSSVETFRLIMFFKINDCYFLVPEVIECIVFCG